MHKEAAPQLSIIIVNWNVEGLLAACLDSLPEASGRWWPLTEVIVVDNASTDNSVAMLREGYPWVRVVTLDSNRGFGGGNNAGILASRGRSLCLLNPDTMAHCGSIEKLVDYLEANPEVGIVGPRLLNP